MLHLLRRHPFPVVAHFRYSFVLTYALPATNLEPMLAPGLTLDTFGPWGFVAIAMVQTENLRPANFLEWLGQSFFLIGYRIFTRYTTREGRNLRGLQILRSETDKPLMVLLGNLFTHYKYHPVTVYTGLGQEPTVVDVTIPGRLLAAADISRPAEKLPVDSPFPDWATARRFAGPMPFTFDYERETHSMIRVQGRREEWNPLPVEVDVPTVPYFFHDPTGPFRGRDIQPVLASAFYIADVPYRWDKGIREELPQ